MKIKFCLRLHPDLCLFNFHSLCHTLHSLLHQSETRPESRLLKLLGAGRGSDKMAKHLGRSNYAKKAR